MRSYTNNVGDLIIKYKVIFPKSLSNYQLEKLHEVFKNEKDKEKVEGEIVDIDLMNIENFNNLYVKDKAHDDNCDDDDGTPSCVQQ